MSTRKSSHRTIFLIVSSGSPLALIASSLRSTSKKPVCPMTRSLHPPMAHCRQRVRFAATWREEFFEVPMVFIRPPEFGFQQPRIFLRDILASTTFSNNPQRDDHFFIQVRRRIEVRINKRAGDEVKAQ